MAARPGEGGLTAASQVVEDMAKSAETLGLAVTQTALAADDT